ncbi:hypothetical protein [Actinomadura sp. 9N215]|uniref:hypothetical protein n=1 Tax=Actinomadura sp. 9N215 TaxID=3375150 RepID=UPI00379DBB7D
MVWLTKDAVWFTKDDVMARADTDRYELGLELYEQIGPLQVFADHVVAVVGDDDYQVRLTGADGQLVGECSCPIGRGGVFCEHCVAAAVMAVDVTGPPDAAALLSRVDAVGGASRNSANVDSWAKEAEDLLLTLEQATIDHPAITRPLYQRLLRDLVHDRSHFDAQEDRQMLFDVGERTTAGLVRACLDEPMSPDELAGWVLDLQLEDTGYFFVEVADLVEALGARGLATFRRRLDELDRGLPSEDSYYDEFDDDYDEEAANQRVGIAFVREHFLLAFEPDVEVLKDFYAENPSHHRDRSIAEALRSAGRIDKAISWLEGMQQRELSDDVDLAELYEQRGRHRDAARIRWSIFERWPRQTHYRELLAAAEPLNAVEYAKNRAFSYLEGLQQNDSDGLLGGDVLLAELYELRGQYRDAARIRWDIFACVPDEGFYRDRERAYGALLAAAEPLNAVEYAKNRAFAHLLERAVLFGPTGTAASLVHLLFAIGDVDQAWEMAREFDLDVRELPHMAWALAHQHPAEAISIMLRAAELTIDRRTDYARFNRAAYLLTELKAMHQQAGLDFADCLERFKADYRHKLPLLTALATAGL